MSLLKKILIIFGILVTIIFSTSCNKNKDDKNNSNSLNNESNTEIEDDDTNETVDKILDKAKANIKNVKSYTSKINIEGVLESEGIESSINIDIDKDFIYEPLYIKSQLYSNENIQAGEHNYSVYIVQEDDIVNVYDNVADYWQYESYNISDNEVNTILNFEDVNKNIEKVLLSIEEAEIEENITNDIVKIKANIPKETVYEFLGNLRLFTYIGFSTIPTKDSLNLEPTEVIFTINKNTGEIKEFICDFKYALQSIIDNITSSIANNSGVVKLISKKYNLNIIMSNYNSVEKSDIPDEAKNISKDIIN